jgi:hypothetical protein
VTTAKDAALQLIEVLVCHAPAAAAGLEAAVLQVRTIAHVRMHWKPVSNSCNLFLIHATLNL